MGTVFVYQGSVVRVKDHVKQKRELCLCWVLKLWMMDESKSRSQPQKGQTNIQSQQAITLCQSRKKPEATFYNSQ